MQYEIPKSDIRIYIKLPKTFDWDWVDQEIGFDKVFSFVPEAIYKQISTSTDDAHEEIFRLLTKAAVHYAIILDFPRVKAQLSNYGIDQNNMDKTKPAPWWDVRDLGLKYLKTADGALSKALTQISAIPALKDLIPFFSNNNSIITTPAEFETFYSINNSPDVYMQLVPLLKRAAEIMLSAKIKPCALSDISANAETLALLKSALVFYALYYAANLPSFTMLNNSIVIQYEELPWQKSLILSETMRERSANTFLQMADETVSQIISYINANLTDFPCYVITAPYDYAPIKKKSGLYL